MWYLYKMEFYSATKNEILSMDLENIILREVSYVQKVKDHVFSQMWNINLIQTQQGGHQGEVTYERGRVKESS
jgi:hypothetical protein